jgi:hypothetical protein
MKQKIVGSYRLGDRMVQVVLREGIGGDEFPLPGDIPCSRIKVGADQVYFEDVAGVLLHEAAEMVASVMHYRYAPTNTAADDLLSVTFLMTHAQFSEVCARTGSFLADCLPDVRAAWEKWNKKGR